MSISGRSVLAIFPASGGERYNDGRSGDDEDGNSGNGGGKLHV
jgi:hypothetical protein